MLAALEKTISVTLSIDLKFFVITEKKEFNYDYNEYLKLEPPMCAEVNKEVDYSKRLANNCFILSS